MAWTTTSIRGRARPPLRWPGDAREDPRRVHAVLETSMRSAIGVSPVQQEKPDDYVVATGEAHSVRELVELAFEAAGLDWQAQGVACDPAPGIRVDDFLRTTNPSIYAAGDVCLEHKFTHAAEASARLAVANALFGENRRWSALTIPWCTYTDPEIAHVGLYVSEARERSIPVKTVTVLMHDADRAMIDGQEVGFVKIHLREGTDKILGATVVAAHAGEMINEITLAIDAHIGLSVLATVVHAYPTQAGAIKRAADAFAKSRLKPPPGQDISRPDWPTD